MSRVSREQAAANRSKVVAAASALFRQSGVEAVGIDDVMAKAGLTRGGFYGQFGSKDGLAGEACTHAFDAAERAWVETLGRDAEGRLQRLAAFYFSPWPPAGGCPMATLAADSAHAPPGAPIRQAFTAGLRRLMGLISGETRDDRALAVLAAMVGAAVLKRASDDPELANSIEAAVLALTKR